MMKELLRTIITVTSWGRPPLISSMASIMIRALITIQVRKEELVVSNNIQSIEIALI
jgi:hypothetical protein